MLYITFHGMTLINVLFHKIFDIYYAKSADD